MSRDLLQFSPRLAPVPHRTVDVAVAALPLLRKLAERLTLAIEFARQVRGLQRPTGEPPLFFFHAPAATTEPALADSPEAVTVARRRPDLAAAWAELHDLVDDAYLLAAADVKVRHAARAVPELVRRLRSIASMHTRCRHLSGLLSVVDDEAVVVLMPQEFRGWRFAVRGLADLGQFHLLFADHLPESGLDARFADACRYEPVDPDCSTATAKYQFYAPAALGSDGSLPAGFAGNEHWQWEHQSFGTMPRVNGERVLLAGPPPYPRQWLVGRRYAAVAGEMELLEVMSESTVRERLSDLGAVELPPRVVLLAA